MSATAPDWTLRPARPDDREFLRRVREVWRDDIRARLRRRPDGVLRDS